MPIELSFASGKRATLPAGIAMPTEWALAAACLAADGMFKSIAHLQPSKERPYQVGDLVELIGYFQAMASYVQNPPQEVLEHERDLPSLTPLRTPLTKQTAKGFKQFLQRVMRLKKVKGAVPPAEALVEISERYTKGLKGFATMDGEMMGLKSMTVRVYYLIWMFWPDLRHRFTAPEIHSWFRKELGETMSDSTVEAAVTLLRKESKKHITTLIRKRLH